jgi:hypothetical protein
VQRVSVTDGGVRVHRAEPPLVSMYGKVVRSGWESDDLFAWPEIAAISLCGLEMPDGDPWVTLDIDFPNGHFVSVSQEAEGFEEAVRAIAARAGISAPDLSTLDSVVTVWPRC